MREREREEKDDEAKKEEETEREREREGEAYHSAGSNTMRTIVPTFAIHSNSWRRDMQPAWGLHFARGVHARTTIHM